VADVPLHLPASCGYHEAAPIHLEHDESVATIDNLKEIPLHHAARFNKFVALTLLDCGAPVDAKDSSESTTLYIAVQRGHTTIMDALIRKKATVDKKTPEE
jgi:ankyrin repeat protein